MECAIGNDKAVFVVNRSLAFDPGGCGFESRQGQKIFFSICVFFIIHNQLTIFQFVWDLHHEFYIHLALSKLHSKIINSYIILGMIDLQRKYR